MNWKEHASLLISIAALLISATNSYFTFFWEKTALGAVVLNVAFDKEATTADVAVLNTGTRQVALTEANLYLVELDGAQTFLQPSSIRIVSTEKTSFPVLVEPGKIILFAIRGAWPLKSLAAHRQTIGAREDQSHERTMGVDITALGATGVPMEATLQVIEIHLRGTSVEGAKIRGNVNAFVQCVNPRRPCPRPSK